MLLEWTVAKFWNFDVVSSRPDAQKLQQAHLAGLVALLQAHPWMTFKGILKWPRASSVNEARASGVLDGTLY